MSVFKKNARALITGGASGIGLATAEFCIKNGMSVSIVDFNKDTLQLAEKTLQGDVKFIQADVGSAEDWKRVKESVGKVDFLMLNAGVGGQGTWGDEAYFQKILNTNLIGVINGISTYFPSFQSRNDDGASPAAIVITGSKQGITNPPGNPAYNASKAAVKTLAEHLSWDLKDKKSVGVHLLVPGWTFTGMSGNTPGTSPTKPAGAWGPDQVVSYMHQKMQDGKFYIICPDNDVSEAMDKKRMLWTTNDIVQERAPLSRWRGEYKDEVEKWMAE